MLVKIRLEFRPMGTAIGSSYMEDGNFNFFDCVVAQPVDWLLQALRTGDCRVFLVDAQLYLRENQLRVEARVT